MSFGLIGLGLLSGNQGSAGGGMLVTGALYAAAALRGSNVVDRCRASFDDYDREVQGPIVVDQDARKLTFPTAHLVVPPVRIPAPPPPPPVEAAAEPETHEAEAAPPAPPPAPAPVPTNQDAFHTTVGQEPPVRAARQVATPAPAMSPWREFWREVP